MEGLVILFYTGCLEMYISLNKKHAAVNMKQTGGCFKHPPAGG